MRIRFRPNPGSTVGFAVQLFFQLIFFGVGCFALGYAYVQYQQGAPTQQLYVFAGVGAMFMLVSTIGVFRAWRGRRQAQHVKQLREKFADTPWRVRPEWRSDEMVADGGLSWSLAIFALVWNGFSWPLAAYVLYTELQGAGFQWGALMVLLFPLAGIGIGWMALSGVLRRRKFGTTKLTMEDMPGRLGDSLRLRVQTGVKQSEAPDEGFHVRLSCYRRYIRYTHDSDGDRRREVEKDLLWRDEKKVRGRTYGSDGRLEVPVTFELPTNQPPSTPEKRDERIMWEVDLDAEVPRLDFQAAFEIPVFAPEEESSAPSEAQASGISTAEPTGAEASSESEMTTQRTDETAPKPEENPYEGYELGTDFTEPVSEGITMQTSPGGGLELHFAAGRNKGSAILLSVLAVVTGVGGLYMITASFFGALILFLFTGLTGYGAWHQWTTASTLTIENGTVTLVRGPFGKGTPTTFSCTDLADVSLKANGHAGSTTYYDMLLHRLDAGDQQDAIESSEQAEKVAQFLHSTGLVAGPNADATMEQIQQNIREQSTQLKVASGLTNKQEADWLAARIKKAAQREAQFA